jgi:hypothetical protein
MFLGKIVSCSSSGVNGSKTVVVSPMIATLDANGNKQPSVNLVELPHYRIQAGTDAVIIDPEPGDIGVFLCAKRDISNIREGGDVNQVPASFRQFDLADAVMIATIHTKTPTTYIRFKKDGSIEMTAPSSMTINTPLLTLNGDLKVNGKIDSSGNISSSSNIGAEGTVTGGGIVLNTHTHSGVQPGSGNTGGPN